MYNISNKVIIIVSFRSYLFSRLFMFNQKLRCCHLMNSFYQRVSIASYASAGIARAEMSVRPSVRPSVCPSIRHTPILYQNEES